ncbi:hypothetical protein PV328_009925 [Microctonus aethiopoides]|uniref:ABC transporter domain-containing protein n=1 Tax=Microctonus aethiopoides TaxID=144406 RepID=A0AA39C6U8_9HYME|nr:hypothetical protein PV328_009925 [Microctonus aethiopoides]
MAEKFRLFMLLMRKNFLIRKHHWIQSLVFQVLIPIGLLLIGQTVRLMSNNQAEFISHNSTHDFEIEDDLMLDVSGLISVKYTPSNTITDKIMEDTRLCLGLTADQVTISKDENNMVKDFHRDKAKNQFMGDCIGIIFESIPNNKTLPKLFKYKLRSSVEAPAELYDPEVNGNIAKYDSFGRHTSTVQVPLCLDKSYIKQVKPNALYQTKISIQQMPYPPYLKVDRVVSTSGTTFADLSRLAFLVVLCVEITFPANEKLIGINILMSVNGVSNRLNLLSWFVSAAIWSTSYLMPIVLILKHFMPPTVLPFLMYGNPFLLWLALFIHTCHLLAFGYHLSSYFWKPSHGVFAAIMTISLMNIFSTFLHGTAIRRFLLYLGIITPNFILKRIFIEVAADENRLNGIQWSNLFTTSGDNIAEGSIGVMIIFSIIGILFHLFMVNYIYAVRPGKYGVPQHPLYCFQRRGKNKVNDDKHMMNFDRKEPAKKEYEHVEPGSLEPGIRIRDLKKIYTTDWLRQTKVNALRGVSMDIYKSQITALLGHNGAGKTTMMSILAGLTDSTEGVVFIDGKNILNETNNSNKNIGLCPQENMVFPDLTVHQQLMLFGMIKANNKTRLQMENEIRILLEKVNLTDKKNVFPSQLSGGQKRRLCLALAIIGDAKVLILDEPTSGMDAESKREVWDIVLKMRGEKTIIISTHDMEEADILGDRIAIMHTGKLRSYGTSMFLKKLYGDGQVEVTLSIEPWCEVSKIFEEIGITAHILSQDDGKIILALPPAESLPIALDRLENSKKNLGITGMSVSIITLEQVFLRVTKDEGDEQDYNEDIKVYEKVTGFLYYLQAFDAFFVKKIIYARKNSWGFWISVILPSISVILILLQFGRRTNPNDPYPILLRTYGSTKAFYHSDKSLLGNMYRETIEGYGGNATKIDSSMNVNEALLNYATNNIVLYRNKVIVSAEFNSTPDGNVIANGFYSGTAALGIPLTIKSITNTIVKALTNDEEYKIEMSTHTLPDVQTFDKGQQEVGILMTVSMIVFLAPALALYVVQPLTEALTGVKQLQLMTGAPKSMYWAANFIFDFIQYLMSILLLLAGFITIDIILETQLYHATEIKITFGLLVLFGLSVLPLVYLTTFLKRTVNATKMILSFAPIILAFVEMILLIVAFGTDNEFYRIFRKIQSKIFMLLPHLSLTYGHLAFFTTLMRNARCRRMSNDLLEISCLSIDECCFMLCSDHKCDNAHPYFTKQDFVPDLETSLLWLGFSPFFYFFLIFIIEQQYFQRLIARIRSNQLTVDTPTMDEIVKKEKSIVNEEIAKKIKGYNSKHHHNGNILLVQGLKKNYGNLHAVKGVHFRVKDSECFGLLGVNGAGKSTTFKMLTGEIIPNGGTVYLKQYNITLDRTKYLSSMGYCPQQDAIISTLNTWDHLYLFGRLRGIPPSQLPIVVKQWVTKLNLTPCAFQPSGTYSGGNKRRLNIAMSLIGNPQLVLMDEPTTGVDPAARRSLWNTLKSCQNSGQSIILTSHSMEECEMLCNRLVIMVGGEIVCVGASQQLKQRFGAGYNIHVKLASTYQQNSDVETIKQRIVAKLNCNLIDENTGFLGYHVVDPEVTWTTMYNLMDELKNEFDCIEDYAVLSSTLEQLFIQFARSSNKNNNGNEHSNGVGQNGSSWWRKENGASPV